MNVTGWSPRPAFWSWWRVLSRNSYDAPKHDPPWAVPTTTGPGSQERCHAVARLERVVERADRLRVAPLGAEAGDPLERQPRAGGDHEPVVGDSP